MYTRRHILASTIAAPAILRFGIGTAQAATTIKISHQFPGGSIDSGDFRDRLCRVFAAELAKRTIWLAIVGSLPIALTMRPMSTFGSLSIC